MGIWTVRGGNRLYGTVPVQGSRDGALPILAASLMHPGVTVLERVPRVTDVRRFLDILRHLGCRVRQEGERVTVDAAAAVYREIPRELTDGLRAAVLFLGPMAARFGQGSVPMPESCSMGPRPLDLHIAALSCLGCNPELDESHIRCTAAAGGIVTLPYPSVGATCQAMLIACGGAGESVLRGCAGEPEVADLALYLTKCGHTIDGAGTDTMTILPGKFTGKVCHRMTADRIAAAALLCAVAACGGKLTLLDIFAPHLQPILDGLAEMGCNIKIRDDVVILQSYGRLSAPGSVIAAGPYPAFPADAMPAFLAACLRADGVAVVQEHLPMGHCKGVKLLRRFGGVLSFTEDNSVVVSGPVELNSANPEVWDVQTGVAMLVAALQAPGENHIIDHGCIGRGYAYLDAILRQLGAEISYSE